VYRIDARDKLTHVNDDWVAFAQQNQAPELVPGNLLGEEIWLFIRGQTIRDLYQAMFDRVRVLRTELIAPFRCDSPDTVRQMELTMRPLPQGGIEFDGRVLSMGTRENVYLFDRYVRRTRRTIAICSFCRRLEVGGHWLEASEAVSRYPYFSGTAQPKLSEEICTGCSGVGV
jgi:hypothetical protein